MERFVRSWLRTEKLQDEMMMPLRLKTTRLWKILPTRADKERKTLTQLANELGTSRKDDLSDGLQLLKKYGLAQFDRKKRGWYRLG